MRSKKIIFRLVMFSLSFAFQTEIAFSCEQSSDIFATETIELDSGHRYTVQVMNDGLVHLGDSKGLRTLSQAPVLFKEFPDSKLISVNMPLFPYTMEKVFTYFNGRHYYEHWHQIKAENMFVLDFKTYGFLTLPEGNGPCPGVILRHGSEGCNPIFYLYYAELLKKHGIASFLFSPDYLHSLQASGHTPQTPSCGSFSTSRNQLSVPVEQTILATFGAAEILATHPRIVGQKIGLIGWSRGGTDVLDCLSQQHQKYLNPSVRFSAGISFYPFPIFHEPDTLTAPLLVLLGEKDNYTPITPVLRYLEMLTGDKTIEIYPNAGHAFDDCFKRVDAEKKEEIKEYKDFQNFSTLYFDVTRTSKGERIFTSPVYSNTLTFQEFLPFLMTHMQFGASTHSNPEAGKKAEEAVVFFMKRHLFE